MIVANRWVTRFRYNRRNETTRVRYLRQWKEVPYVPGTYQRVWYGLIASDGCFYHARFNQPMLPAVDLGSFDSLTDAQEAIDAAVAEAAGIPLAEAVANWKTWVCQRRAEARAARLNRKLPQRV